MNAETLFDYIRDDALDDNYTLCALAITRDTPEADPREKWAKPVQRIELDAEHSELLLFVDAPEFLSHGKMDQEGGVTLGALRSFLTENSDSAEYSVCVAEEWSEEDTFIRLDSPATGTGENPDWRRYFIVVNKSD